LLASSSSASNLSIADLNFSVLSILAALSTPGRVLTNSQADIETPPSPPKPWARFLTQTTYPLSPINVQNLTPLSSENQSAPSLCFLANCKISEYRNSVR